MRKPSSLTRTVTAHTSPEVVEPTPPEFVVDSGTGEVTDQIAFYIPVGGPRAGMHTWDQVLAHTRSGAWVFEDEDHDDGVTIVFLRPGPVFTD